MRCKFGGAEMPNEPWKLTPKNWERFQHYKDRAPPWIKLHRGLLDDYKFHCLPVASRALAPCIWLLAAEYDGGEICASPEEIAYRLHCSVESFVEAVKPLIDAGFLTASNVLADCYQDAMPEKRRGREDSDSLRRESADNLFGSDLPPTTKPNGHAPVQRPVSVEADLYARAKDVLGAKSGGLITKLLQKNNKDVLKVMGILEDAADTHDPREYVNGVLKGKRAEDLKSIVGY
jgi:hypothetical protein